MKIVDFKVQQQLFTVRKSHSIKSAVEQLHKHKGTLHLEKDNDERNVEKHGLSGGGRCWLNGGVAVVVMKTFNGFTSHALILVVLEILFRRLD